MRLKVISMQKKVIQFGAVNRVSIRFPWEAFEVLGKAVH
ncbi:hypothetical protein VIBHAR_02829 [Vibrio campbellii ATCC BAA-1116]|uniref:Uncharacterized protein n=1 Tax=Vibrio campbellii (strain ATCC BAA-1116) TaxID=2902295 RepID=A7MUS5_VIBC1|nr:hypothetical protein VIBHAR_02829 [Vibrio campbellii ATCC BAA-1116]